MIDKHFFYIVCFNQLSINFVRCVLSDKIHKIYLTLPFQKSYKDISTYIKLMANDSSKINFTDIVERHKLELEAAFNRKHDLHKALENYQKLLVQNVRLNNVGGEAKALNEIGKIYCEMGFRENGMKIHVQLTQVLLKTIGKKMKINYFTDLRNFYEKIGDFTTSDFFNKQLSSI